MHQIPLYDWMVAPKTTKIGSDHRKTVSDLLKTTVDHQEFRGCRWSPTGLTIGVTGLMVTWLKLGILPCECVVLLSDSPILLLHCMLRISASNLCTAMLNLPPTHLNGHLPILFCTRANLKTWCIYIIRSSYIFGGKMYQPQAKEEPDISVNETVSTSKELWSRPHLVLCHEFLPRPIIFCISSV